MFQDLYPESADVIKLDDHMCYVYDGMCEA